MPLTLRSHRHNLLSVCPLHLLLHTKKKMSPELCLHQYEYWHYFIKRYRSNRLSMRVRKRKIVMKSELWLCWVKETLTSGIKTKGLICSVVLHVWLWQTALSICRWEEATAVSVLETQSHRTSQSESFQHRSCPCAAESSVEDSGKTPAEEFTLFIHNSFQFSFNSISSESLKHFNAPVCHSLTGWASSQRPPARPAGWPLRCCISPSCRSLPPACCGRCAPPLTGSSTALSHRSETYSPLLPPQLKANHIMNNRVLHTKYWTSDFWVAQSLESGRCPVLWIPLSATLSELTGGVSSTEITVLRNQQQP